MDALRLAVRSSYLKGSSQSWRHAAAMTFKPCRMTKALTAPLLVRMQSQNAFESLGIYPPLAKSLGENLSIYEPTELQELYIPPILEGRDVVIRDTTGSGKTFGVLLALINKPRQYLHTEAIVDNKQGHTNTKHQHNKLPLISSVVLVPNQELAFQLLAWTREVLPTGLVSNQAELDRMIQVLVTDEPHATDAQIDRLVKNVPHIIVATPKRLLELLETETLDLSHLETLVLDEVDHLLRIPKRFATQKQIMNREKHPKPAELAIRIIKDMKAGLQEKTAMRAISSSPLSSPSDTSAPLNMLSSTNNNNPVVKKIQVIAASATMNRPMRDWMIQEGMIDDPVMADITKATLAPKGIRHYCLVIGPDSVRNMKPDREAYDPEKYPPGNKHIKKHLEHVREHERELHEEEREKGHDQEADLEESWKDQQIAKGEAAHLASHQESEKFSDEDDRMLESVFNAVTLDGAQNGVVFMTTNASLPTIATRLKDDFGMTVKKLDAIFHQNKGHNDQLLRRLSGNTKVGKDKELTKGFFIAQETNARGLDLPGLSHVYIVGLPASPASYLHMAGRTGRMGKEGKVITIIRDDGHLEDRARTMFNTLNITVEPFEHVE